MKTCIFLLAVIFSINSNAQISLSQMNGIKVNTTLTEVEKVIGQQIELKGGANNQDFSTTVKNKGIDFELSFINPCVADEKPCYMLEEIATVSTQIKTSEKVGVGSHLNDLKKAYKKYDSKKNYFTGMSEYKDGFFIRDDKKGMVLFFDLKENKVTKIILSYFPA
ncbi:MAG: hypothetical protein WBF83_04410, partial [Moheibacter sp.]